MVLERNIKGHNTQRPVPSPSDLQSWRECFRVWLLIWDGTNSSAAQVYAQLVSGKDFSVVGIGNGDCKLLRVTGNEGQWRGEQCVESVVLPLRNTTDLKVSPVSSVYWDRKPNA